VFPLASLAQKKPVRRAPAAPKPTPTPDLKVEAGQIAEQIKNFSKFIYIYGKIINGFEVADEQAREGKMTPAAATKNRESKEALVGSVRNLKVGLDNLTRSFQNNPRLQVQSLKVAFAADAAAEAEKLAAAGCFDEAGKALVIVIERLTNVISGEMASTSSLPQSCRSPMAISLNPMATDRRPETSNQDNTLSAINRIRNAPHQDIPTPTSVFDSGIGGGKWTINNATGRILTVYLSGPITRTVTILNGQTNEIDISTGEYQIAAEVSGGGVMPFYSQRRFNSSTRYSSRFYIR
ncbi:MAG: hypothetical protein JNK38_02205, partial [Acidobacteria bacterium]|nr:hypothetical protein [Acidobacteriota bacterium]